MTGRTLVLGIGNTLLGDEGVGVHAMHALETLLAGATDVDFVDGGTLSFSLSRAIEDAAQLLVIDAAQLDAEPGTSAIFSGERMDAFIGGSRKLSVHEVSLLDLMAIARLTGRLPQQRALIGVQPGTIGWSETPTAAVAAAIPQVCREAMQIIETWHA
jgi:hydrogenase maturation protease